LKGSGTKSSVARVTCLFFFSQTPFRKVHHLYPYSGKVLTSASRHYCRLCSVEVIRKASRLAETDVSRYEYLWQQQQQSRGFSLFNPFLHISYINMATRLNPNPNPSRKKIAQLGNGTRVRHRHITTMRPPYQLRTSYNGPVWFQTRGVKGASALLGISSIALGKRRDGKKKGRFFAAFSSLSNKTKKEGKSKYGHAEYCYCFANSRFGPLQEMTIISHCSSASCINCSIERRCKTPVSKRILLTGGAR
jgi:hypothetical protein